MSGIGESSWLQNEKYAKFKNEKDHQTSVIVIPPLSEQNNGSTGKGLRILNFNLNLKLMSIFIVATIFIIIFIAGNFTLYFKEVPNKTFSLTTNGEISHTLDSGVHAKLENAEEVNLKTTQETTEINNEQSSTSVISATHSRNVSLNKCVPLKNVEKVILMNIKIDWYSKLQKEGYFCSDNATCHSLLRKIEEEQNGSKYNFVIGAGGELYVGLGFRCLMNSSENALYIKYIEEQPSHHGRRISKIKEVIDQGVSCGYISENFTLLHEQNGSQIVIDESLFYHHSTQHREHGQNQSLHFHDPSHEMRTLIHGDFKWTVCGNFSNTTEVRRSRVITLDSIPKSTCLPLEPVNEIVVDVVETDPFSCSDNSSCIQLFEEQHEGFKYNFIIGNDYEVYVGLGYKCHAENTPGTMLRIRVLVDPEYEQHFFYTPKHRKFAQILEEGVACNKVLEHFSVEAHCPDSVDIYCDLGYNSFRSKRDLDYVLLSVFGIYTEEDYNITSEHGRGIVPYKSRFRACNREHMTKQNQTEAAVDAEPTADTTSHSSVLDGDLYSSEHNTTASTVDVEPTDETTTSSDLLNIEFPSDYDYIDYD